MTGSLDGRMAARVYSKRKMEPIIAQLDEGMWESIDEDFTLLRFSAAM
jgi:hypothetical protein